MVWKQTLWVAASALVSFSASAVTTWDLAADFAPPSNPNGAWAYGEVSGPTLAFSPLAWNAPTSSYGVAAAGQTFVYQNTGVFDYGIATGQVSLESDWGNAAVRWTAPVAGDYSFSIAIGGTTASGPSGYGNNFAQYGGVLVNGVAVASNSFVSNVATWNFTLSLAASSTVDAFVQNPGFANGGNTQTTFSVTAVPEPASLLLALAGLGVVAGVGRRRSGAGACQRT